MRLTDAAAIKVGAADATAVHLGATTLLLRKIGNSQSYAAAPYSAYTGMWGAASATSTMRVIPSSFPAGTMFTWDVDPANDAVNGYLRVDYGNYEESPGAGTVTPLQVSSIAELTVGVGWTFTGDESSGLLCELWLASAATPTGPIPKLHEVGFAPKVSPSTQTWLATLPAVGSGSFTDSGGVVWNVAESTSGTGEPYYVAYRPGYVDFEGELRFTDYFAFLLDAGKIAATEWVNGVGFGVEPYSGSGTLTVDKFTPTFTAKVSPPVVDTFTAATLDTTTKWKGATYGVSVVSGRLRVPCSNTFPQAATGAVQNLTAYDVWVEMPTVPSAGNGTKQTQFIIKSGSNLASFNVTGAALGIAMTVTGQANTSVTYNATNHRWLRFRLSGGNLLWQASPDGSTWTTLRTIAAPTWVTSNLLDAVLTSSYYGTETEGTYAEFDNFCAPPA